MDNDIIKLAHGSGGSEMGELIGTIRKNVPYKGDWQCTDEDSAVLRIPPFIPPIQAGPSPPCKGGEKIESVCLAKGESEFARKNRLAFTTDAFVVSPIFFSGGNIGDLAFNGTINDLLVEGARPLGISLSIVVEEGFLMDNFEKILKTIGDTSKEINVPVATGDTKVVTKGAIDKIMITTAGVGILERIISDGGLEEGDMIISSGDLGSHGASLLANRFNYKTRLQSDTKSVINEVGAVRNYLTSAKDPTRGGIASVLNEMANKSRVKIVLNEDDIPIKKETASIGKLLGINKYSLASEGRFVAGVKKENTENVIKILKGFNENSCVMGRVEGGEGVFIKNVFGEKRLDIPEGIIVPRIC